MADMPPVPAWCKKCNQAMDKFDEYVDPNFGKVTKYRCPVCKSEKIDY